MYGWCAYCGKFVRSEEMSKLSYLCRQCSQVASEKHLHLIGLEAKRVAVHVNRAKELGAAATLTLEEWFACLDYWDYKCVVCDNPHRRGMDHWKNLGSKFAGVTHYIGTIATNVWSLCQTCNVKKRTFEPEQWLMMLDTSGVKLAEVNRYFDWIASPPMERVALTRFQGSSYNERLVTALNNYKLVDHKKMYTKKRRQKAITAQDRQQAIAKIKPFVQD
jgi:hypothetical protein